MGLTGSQVAAVRAVLPPYRYSQEELTGLAAELCLPPGADPEPLRRLHKAAGVQTRHLALPLERYHSLSGFTDANDAWIEAAGDLGAQAITEALDAAGLAPEDVDVLACASVTGLAVPSVDARLAGRLGLRDDVKRLPLFGLGCVAGAAGIARLHDHLLGHPGDVAVLLAVELCSLTVQRGDDSPANLVAGALFGDGAAAVVLRGGARGTPGGGPVVAATRSRLYPGTEAVMGWAIGSSGFRVVLSPDVPEVVRAHLRADVDAFLARHGLSRPDIGFWVCHPGGPKVLDAVEETLALPPGALDVTWRSLAAVGNLSSASVLHVLAGTLAERPPAPGTWGLLLAMGPGFCCELVLLRG